jgi:hypothetical protein
MQAKLKEQIRVIQQNTTVTQVNKLNSMIMGMHNYYQTATLCSQDFAKINYIVSRSLHNRLKGKTKKVKGRIKKPETEPPKSKTYQKLYGDYNQKPKIVAGIHLFPIYGCTFKAPLNFTQETNNFTIKGRELVHKNLSVMPLIRYLLNSKEYDKSVKYNDNRISLMAGQQGKCAVTNEPLVINAMHCHHKKPKEIGGTDDYDNLVWLNALVHKLIHATETDTIAKYLNKLQLDKKALKKVNSLRLLAENLEIEVTAV